MAAVAVAVAASGMNVVRCGGASLNFEHMYANVIAATDVYNHHQLFRAKVLLILYGILSVSAMVYCILLTGSLIRSVCARISSIASDGAIWYSIFCCCCCCYFELCVNCECVLCGIYTL